MLTTLQPLTDSTGTVFYHTQKNLHISAHVLAHTHTRTLTHTYTHAYAHRVTGAHEYNLATVNVYLQLLFSISAMGGEETAPIDRVSPEMLSTAS